MDAIAASQRADTRLTEAGFTLVEILVVVAMLVIIAGSAYETLAQRPAQARSAAVAFAGLVEQARSLASVTGDATLESGSGSTIGVTREGDVYVATLYTYRPILGATHVPEPEFNSAPLRFTTALALATASGFTQPPFALFFSASGHASAQAGFTVGVSPALASEPVCRLETGIAIEFSDLTQTQSHAISCEMAQLDLEGAGEHATAATGTPGPLVVAK